MHIPRLLHFLPVLSLALAQAAPGGGGPESTLAATQSPTVSTVNSLQTVGGSTVAVQVVFTQTFATTALGTWPLGTVVQTGVIGLGTIAGSVGEVKTAS
jgi:hypothetical protein